MNTKTKIKIALAIIFSLLFICFGGYYLLISLMAIQAPHFSNEKKEGNMTFQADQTQNFYLRYVTTSLPSRRTHVMILSNDKKEVIGSYHIDSEFVKPNISLILNSGKLKCYELTSVGVDRAEGETDLLLYSINKSEYKAFTGEISGLSKEESDTLYPIAKQLFMTKKWERVNLCGYLLLYMGDKEANDCLERYAKADYTQEEMSINANSSISASNMQVFAECFLGRYQKALQSSSKQSSSK